MAHYESGIRPISLQAPTSVRVLVTKPQRPTAVPHTSGQRPAAAMGSILMTNMVVSG